MARDGLPFCDPARQFQTKPHEVISGAANHPSNVVEYGEAQPPGTGIPVLRVQNECKLAEAIALDCDQPLAGLRIALLLRSL